MATPKQTDPQFKLRLTPELKERIEIAAERNNRSMNAEIVERIDGWDDLIEQLNLAHTGWALSKAEVERLRSELDEAQKKLLSAFDSVEKEVQKLSYLDGRRIPEGLFNRIVKAADEHGRPVDEEVVQALERGFPLPPTIEDTIESLTGLFERYDLRRQGIDPYAGPDRDRENRRMEALRFYMNFLQQELVAGRAEGARERFRELYEELPDGSLAKRNGSE